MHQQQGVVEHTQGLRSLPFWDRQQQLDARLEQALKGMSLDDPYTLIFQDPMVYFTVLAAQASTLMLFKSCRTAPWGMEDTTNDAAQHEQRAVVAAQQMTTLSKALIELSYFKVSFPDNMPLCLISNDLLLPRFILSRRFFSIFARMLLARTHSSIRPLRCSWSYILCYRP